MNMKGISPKLYGFSSQIIHFAGIPIFFFIFSMIYNPMGIREFLDKGWGGTDFHITIISTIILLCLVGTRLMMYFIRKHLNLTKILYLGWCIAEIIVCTLFAALYLWLMFRMDRSYFMMAGAFLKYTMSILVYPYLIAYLFLKSEGLEENPQPAEDGIIRFKDSSQKLKISIAASAVLYLEAKENYVKIWYKDGEKTKSYTLRNTMKRTEELVTSHGMVRCQRAYCVNPAHVKVLRKDQSGFIFADLDQDGCPSIPVSKTYYESLSALL